MQFVHAPSDKELLHFVEAWIDALACGDYARAYAMTEHDPYYGWSPDLIRSVVEGYGLPEPRPGGERFVLTPRESAMGGVPARVVEREVLPPGALATIRHGLPLKGVWSDLTATFRIEPRGGGLAVVLEEIHVL